MIPSPETHVFVGMFRPQFHECLKQARDRDPMGWCEGEILHLWQRDGIEKCRHAWLFGRWDTPVYKTIEEVVRMKEAV